MWTDKHIFLTDNSLSLPDPAQVEEPAGKDSSGQCVNCSCNNVYCSDSLPFNNTKQSNTFFKGTLMLFNIITKQIQLLSTELKKIYL
jgi:hypothetical protein